MAIGRFSLKNNTTGDTNISIGSGSLRNNTDGTKNISIGNFALFTNTGGDFNIAIGSASLYSNTTANNNISIGAGAGYALQTAGDNTIIGFSAGFRITSAQNTILGSKAGGAITTGNNNIIIGYNTVNGGSFAVTGDNNIVMGNASGLAMNSATRNVLIGNNSGQSIQSAAYNVIIGTDAGKGLSSGGANTIIGDLAGQAITGQNNVLLGANADGSATSANTSNKVVIGVSAGNGYPLQSDQVIIGYNSAYSLQGFRNTFVGHRTGEDATSADDNVLLGYQAGLNLTQGDSNVIIGASAGDALTNVSNLVLIGKDAGGGSLTGADNVFIGTNAGKVATSAEKNVIIGGEAGDALTTADNCVIIGYSAGGAGLSGNNNVFVGFNAGLAATTPTSNTFVGTRAGDVVTTGFENTFMGTDTGNTITTGDRNIFIGYAAGGLVGQGVAAADGGVAPNAGTQNNIIIGNNVGVIVAGNNNQVVLGNDASLNYYYWANANNWQGQSDSRDKINTSSLDVGLNFIRDIQPKKYVWNKRSRYENSGSVDTSLADTQATWGIMAQDLVALTTTYPALSSSFVITSASYRDGSSYDVYMISEFGLIFPTIQAVKDLDAITAKTGSNTFNDTQTISGSLRVSGSVSMTGPVSMTGSFSGSIFGAIGSIVDNNTNNYVVTTTGDAKLNGEQDLQFDSSQTRKVLTITNGYIDITDVTSSNLAIGKNTLQSSPQGTNNIAIGSGSLRFNTGYNNTAIGYASAVDMNDGYDNTTIGYAAGFSMNGAYQNTIIGSKAGGAVDFAVNNVIIGYNAVNGTVAPFEGDSNVVIGANTYKRASSGSNNVIIGNEAIEGAAAATSSGDNNVVIGYRAGRFLSSGYSNTIVGTQAGDSLLTGYRNTILGELAGETNSAWSENIFIGYRAGAPVFGYSYGGNSPTNDGKNNIVIGNGVGPLQITGSVVLGNNQSTTYYKWGGAAWTHASDGRDKTDTGSLDLGLEMIRQLNPKYYKWNARSFYDTSTSSYNPSVTSSRFEFGVIAQDLVALTSSYSRLSEIIEVVSGSYGNGETYEQYMFSGGSLLFPTIQAIKDLDSITPKTGSNVFNGTQTITGSLRVSGSASTGLFVQGMTQSTDSLTRVTYNTTTGRVLYEPAKFISAPIGDIFNTSFTITHSLNSTYIQVSIQDTGTKQIWYPTVDTGSSMAGMYHVKINSSDDITLDFATAPGVNQYVVIVSK
jgi:hypothetical protein